MRQAEVLPSRRMRKQSGGSLEPTHGLGQLVGIAVEQPAGVGRDRVERRNSRGKLRPAARVRYCALGELAVAYREGHSHHLRLVGDIHPEPAQHTLALRLAHRAEPFVSLPRKAIGRCLQTQQPGGVTTDTRRALVQHRLGDLARLANLPAVTGVERQAPQRDHARGVQDVGDGGSMGIKPIVKHRRGIVEATHLQEQMSPRDLRGVQEREGKPRLERLGDDAVDRLERVFLAMEGVECDRAPQPGEELVESVCFYEPVAQNRLEQLERAREVPADVLKTPLAEREWEPGNPVKARAGGYGR